MKHNKIAHRSIMSFVMTAVLIFTISVPVFAATVGFSNISFYWNQATTSEKILSECHFDSGTNVYFEARATTAASGTYTVTLQKKDFFGVYHDVGTRTLPQNSNMTTNVRTGILASGQWSRTSWAGTGSGTYRIILRRVTNTQQVYFNECWFYIE